MLNPAFLPNDFLTNSYVHTPRDTFAQMIVGFTQLFGTSWWQSFLSLKGFTVSLFLPIFYFALTKLLPQLRSAAFRMVFLFFSITYLAVSDRLSLRLAELETIQSKFIPQSVALILACVSLVTWFQPQRRFKALALFVMALSTVVHPVLGLCFCVFSFLAAVPLSSTPLKTLTFLLPPFLVSLGTAFALALHYRNLDSLPLSELVRIYVLERHPHHFSVPTIFRNEWPNHLLVSAAFLLAIGISWTVQNNRLRRAGLIWLAFFVGIPLVQYFFVQLLPVRIMVVFGFTRFYLFTYWFIVILFGALGADSPPWLAQKIAGIDAFLRTCFPAFSSVLVGLAVLLAAMIPAWSSPLRSCSFGEQAVIHWLKAHTRPSDVVGVVRESGSIRPSFDTSKIRLIAERNVSGDTTFIYNENSLLEWERRWKNLVRSNGQITRLKEIKVDYILAKNNVSFPCQPIAKVSHYSIYKDSECFP